jgi:predicted RNA-binding Zn-ribbon protein involved in translation (DUF1610 family)
MREHEVFRICPNCGSEDVPRLIVRSVRIDGFGSSWECHDCDHSWSDADAHTRSVSSMGHGDR